MKIAKETTKVVLDNKSKNQEFSFKLEEKEIFKLLTSKLYQNPLKSMIQEYLSNARDAHREAKQNKPIEVWLDEYNQLHIKDYGTGLSPKRLKEVFLYFGKSTKRKTNKQIGGFGIGAKSAFAYTDSFTIVNRYGRKKTTYLATIKDEVPTLITLENDKTDKNDTGIEIIIPIKPEDVKKAKKYVYLLTVLWYKGTFSPYDRVDVKLNNVEIDYIIYNSLDVFYDNIIAVNNSKYTILKKYIDELSNSFISIEGIPYRIPEIHFENIIFHFKTGNIKISNNRESIVESEIDKIRNHILDTLKTVVENEPLDKLTHIRVPGNNSIVHKNKYFYFKQKLLPNLQIKRNSYKFYEVVYSNNSTNDYSSLIDTYLTYIVYDPSKISRYKIRMNLKKIKELVNSDNIVFIERSLYEDIIKYSPEFKDIYKIRFLDDYLDKLDTGRKSKSKNNKSKIKAYSLNDLSYVYITEDILQQTVKIYNKEIPKVVYLDRALLRYILSTDKQIIKQFDLYIVTDKKTKEAYKLISFDEAKKIVIDELEELSKKYQKELETLYIIERLSFERIDYNKQLKLLNKDEIINKIPDIVKKYYRLILKAIDLEFNDIVYMIKDYNLASTLEFTKRYKEFNDMYTQILDRLKNMLKEQYDIEIEFE